MSWVWSRAEQAAVGRDREDALHHAGGVLAGRRWSRTAARCSRRARSPAGAGGRLLQQHRELEQVGDVVGLRDDAGADRRRAVAQVGLAGGAEDRQLALGLVRIAHVRRASGRAVASSSSSSARARPRRGWRRRCRGGRVRAVRRPCAHASEFWRRSSGARWKPNTFTARRRWRSRPRVPAARAVGGERAVQHVEVLGERGAPVGLRGGDRVAWRVGRAGCGRWRPGARRCPRSRAGRARRCDAASGRAKASASASRASEADTRPMPSESCAAQDVQLVQIMPSATAHCMASARSSTSAVTKGLPSRSPPIQLPPARRRRARACPAPGRRRRGGPQALA